MPINAVSEKYLEARIKCFTNELENENDSFNMYNNSEACRMNITLQLLFTANIHKLYSASKQRGHNSNEVETLLVEIESCFKSVREFSVKVTEKEKANVTEKGKSFMSLTKGGDLSNSHSFASYLRKFLGLNK